MRNDILDDHYDLLNTPDAVGPSTLAMLATDAFVMPEPSIEDVEEAMMLFRVDHNSKKSRGRIMKRKLANLAFQYGRQSKKMHGDFGQSPERQLEVCEAVRVEHDIPEFAQKFFDRGQRGVFWSERQELMELITLLAKPENYGCYLVVEDVDRLLRDDRVLYRIGPIFLENGIRLYDQTGPVDSGALVEAAARSIAHYKLICQRSLLARRLSMQLGRIHGKLAFGYEYAGRGRARPDANAEHVKMAFAMRERGESTGTIARYFTDLGVPAPGGNNWTTTKVLAMLKRTTYTGTLTYKIKGHEKPLVVQVPGLAIITEEQFEAVQRINALASRPERDLAFISKGEKLPLLLSGHEFCGHCGNKLHAKYHTSTGSRFLVCSAKLEHGDCTCAVKFNSDKTETIVLKAIKRLLDGTLYEAAFRKQLETTDKSRALAIENQRLQDTKELMRERDLYSENRAAAYASRTIAEMEPEFEAARNRIAVLEARISAAVSPRLSEFLEGELLSLRSEMDGLIAAVPFECETPEDEQVRRIVQSIVTSVTLTAFSDTGRRQVTQLDFGAAIGMAGDSRLVFEETLDYEETPELLRLESRERIRKLVSGKEATLRKAEYERLMSEPVVQTTFGDVFGNQFRRFFGVLLLAAELDLPLTLTIGLAGLQKSHFWKAFQTMRSKHVALQQLVEVITDLRGPVTTFFGRIMTKSGPRQRMEAVMHPLLDHPICQDGGTDLSDEQWAVIRPCLVDLMSSKHAAQRALTVRADLNYLYAAVRLGVPMSKVCPKNVGANAMRRLNQLQASGDFEMLTRVMLEQAGKRPRAALYPVPLF